jgi:hypothetical protein
MIRLRIQTVSEEELTTGRGIYRYIGETRYGKAFDFHGT